MKKNIMVAEYALQDITSVKQKNKTCFRITINQRKKKSSFGGRPSRDREEKVRRKKIVFETPRLSANLRWINEIKYVLISYIPSPPLPFLPLAAPPALPHVSTKLICFLLGERVVLLLIRATLGMQVLTTPPPQSRGCARCQILRPQPAPAGNPSKAQQWRP